MLKLKSVIRIACLFVMIAPQALAQSGGGFEITEAVISAGGASASAGIFDADLTIGQPVEPGAIGFGQFGLTSGFWNYVSLAPTAASISISGRVLDDAGGPVANAILYLQTQEGELMVARSSSFGFYRFNNISAGQTVLISVQSRRFTYAPRTVIAADEISGFDFIPEH